MTIASGLDQMGYAVETLNDEYPSNSFGKVLGKIALNLLRKLTLTRLQRLLEKRPRYDLVLIIKGRGLSPGAIRYLKSRAIRVIGYNFDSFRFNPSPLDWLCLTDKYCTFDFRDARLHNLPLVHLFSAADISPSKDRLYDLSIIQRVHSDRLVFARLILQSLPDNARKFVFLYESSLLTFVIGLLKHPWLYAHLWGHISFKPLSHSKAMEILGSSHITFDYAHPSQSGVTIRCFESQSLGVSILTNNQEAVDSNLFEKGSIAYLPRNADQSDTAALIAKLLQQRVEPKRRSLDDFLNDLLSSP